MIKDVRRQVPRNLGLRERKQEEDWKIERFAVHLRHYWGDEIKREEMGNTRCKYGRQEKCRVGKPKRKEAVWTI